MSMKNDPHQIHVNRRSLLTMTGIAGLSWLTPLASCLARQHESSSSKPAKSLIVIWLDGGPSQLETFDPHPDSKISHGSKARKTNVPGIMIGEGLEQLAEIMDTVSLVRSLTSREGDHERAVYNAKTGYRPDPVINHPAIGSIICHQLESYDGSIDIPRHISLLSTQHPARGGYLGDQYDAFQVFNPQSKIPDVYPSVDPVRQQARLEALRFLDHDFTGRRLKGRMNTAPDSLRNPNLDAALRMMSSDQLSAFDLSTVPEKDKAAFGNSSFGLSCLAALRLVTVGVRCVEVTLQGWDTHVNNHELQSRLIKMLDPALTSLIKELKRREILDSTMVVCGGEFGRTPNLNPLGGRDHWAHGFSFALAGGGIPGGRVIGGTSSESLHPGASPAKRIKDPHPIENLHATILQAFGIRYTQELETPIGRPLKISEGSPIPDLLA